MSPARSITLLLALCIPWTLKAQEVDTLGASRVYAVSVRPVVRPSEEINLSGATAVPTQVAGVLRHFTGVEVKDYGGVGGLKTVNVRSLGSEHVGIFLDGIQIDNAQNMQVDLGRFSTDGLGVVSLFPGQKSRRLQTAKEYASGAAVHLETARPAHRDGSGGKVRLRGGSFGTFNPSLMWDKDLGRAMTLRTAAEFTTSNGRYKYPFFDTTLVRENGDIRSLRLETALFGRVPHGDGMLRVHAYGSERGFPGPVIRRATGFPFSAERQSDQDIFVQGGWNSGWSPRYATALKFKYNYDYTHYDTHPERNPMALPYNLHYYQQSAYVSLAQSFIPSDPWSVDLSTDFQGNSLRSDVGQFVTPRRSTFIGALSLRRAGDFLRMATHLVYLGAWDTFKTPRAGGWSRENGFRDAWMPSLCLYYVPFEWLEADFFAKRSYRMPSFNDLYYSQMGNASLDPESAMQLGGGLRIHGSSPPWGWDVHVSPYLNRVEDKIVAIPTSSQFRWTMLNIGTVDVTGLESKADITFQKGKWAMEMILRHTFQRALDHSDPESRTYGNQIPYIPLHSGEADLQLGWKDWTFRWNTTFTGGRWSRTANIPDYYIDPWTIAEASLFKNITLPAIAGRVDRPSLQVGLTCDNVFDTPYQIVQGYPMPGCSILLSVEYSW